MDTVSQSLNYENNSILRNIKSLLQLKIASVKISKIIYRLTQNNSKRRNNSTIFYNFVS